MNEPAAGSTGKALSFPGRLTRVQCMKLYQQDLEKIAASFPGVEKAFAVQAGRELRVFVQPEHVDDDQAYSLARDIASKIENELQYPGQIRITVIRETRCVEVAK